MSVDEQDRVNPWDRNHYCQKSHAINDLQNAL